MYRSFFCEIKINDYTSGKKGLNNMTKLLRQYRHLLPDLAFLVNYVI